MSMYMEIVCDNDQTQYCIKRMTLFGFHFDQLNLWASYYLQETLNPKVKTFTLISCIILQHKCDNPMFSYPKKINERKKSWKTNKEKEKKNIQKMKTD